MGEPRVVAGCLVLKAAPAREPSRYKVVICHLSKKKGEPRYVVWYIDDKDPADAASISSVKIRSNGGQTIERETPGVEFPVGTGLARRGRVVGLGVVRRDLPRGHHYRRVGLAVDQRFGALSELLGADRDPLDPMEAVRNLLNAVLDGDASHEPSMR